MAKKKIYAVAKGKTVGLFDTWEACKNSVDGFSGAIYKSFTDKGEAQAFLLSNNADIKSAVGVGAVKQAHPARTAGFAPVDTGDSAASGSVVDGGAIGAVAEGEKPAHLTAYVDGSFDAARHRYSYGCVMLLPDGSVETFSGRGDDPESALLRNVTGEMLGSMNAVKWCIEHGYSELEICYDYAGIEMWATGAWKTNKELTQKYAAYMRERMKYIKIRFTKVAAHTGVKWNEEADRLAKEALEG